MNFKATLKKEQFLLSLISICQKNNLTVSFVLQGQVMQANQKGGVIMSTTALALQGVTRSHSGNYSCVASNVEGDGDSNTVQLKIMCKW